MFRISLVIPPPTTAAFCFINLFEVALCGQIKLCINLTNILLYVKLCDRYEDLKGWRVSSRVEFPTFEAILGGLRVLVDDGWKADLHPSNGRRVVLMGAMRDGASVVCDPLTALDVYFAEGGGPFSEDLLVDQSGRLGMPMQVAQWLYAVSADDPAYLRTVDHLSTEGGDVDHKRFEADRARVILALRIGG